jgi:hypothetical protein
MADPEVAALTEDLAPAGTLFTYVTDGAVDRKAQLANLPVGAHDHDADYEAVGAVATHTGDTTDAHDASAISIVDSGAYFTGTDVEAALQELGAGGGGGTDVGGSISQRRGENAAGSTTFWSILPGLHGHVRDFAMAVAANKLYMLPFFVSEPWTPSEFAVRVSTLGAASLGYIWIYAADADLQPTGNVLIDVTAGGALDFSTTGQKAVTGFSTTLQPGWYVAQIRTTVTASIAGFSYSIYMNGGGNTLNTQTLNHLRKETFSGTTPSSPGDKWDNFTAATVLDCAWLWWR